MLRRFTRWLAWLINPNGSNGGCETCGKGRGEVTVLADNGRWETHCRRCYDSTDDLRKLPARWMVTAR